MQPDGLTRASIELLGEDADAPVPESAGFSAKLLERVIEQHPELLERPHRLDSCSWVSSRLAELLPLPLEAKQALLELDDARDAAIPTPVKKLLQDLQENATRSVRSRR